ncbi:MAG: hypothetical protein KBC11_03025 [Candidatus Pacebacteria bacterium]|nr:hypothetical protein [Candidatus Paceibacterota bacterium]
MSEELEPKKEDASQAPKLTMHTYAGDLANALDTTDATVVQELLVEGREREAQEHDEKVRTKQKAWYKAGAIILIIFTITATAYTVYHYIGLTVPAQKTASVGVFPSTQVILTSETDIRNTITTLSSDTSLELNKPALVPLVSNLERLTLLTNAELFSFFEARASEPFLTSFNLFRLGVMDTGNENTPFILASMVDTDIASKELLIAEPELLKLLYKPLNIDIGTIDEEVGKTFVGEYMYNIPVRSLRIAREGFENDLVFFYGRVTDNIVIFTTSPLVLKEVYNSIIRQHQ